MRIAIVSDIHANDVALRTALQDAARCGADVYASLGDIVGYGPSPTESIRLARDSFSVSVLGNHDSAVCGLRDISDFSDYAAEAVRVQRGQLGPVEKTYLKLLPLVWHEGDIAMSHGDFTAPGEFRYVDDERAAAANFAVRSERIMFVGHTHEPCVWMLDETGSVTKLPPANFELLPNRRYIVNPGTVGYPRGGANVCGTYVLYDDKTDIVCFRKVPFDMNAYSRALRAVGRNIERSRALKRIRNTISTAMAAVIGVAVLGVAALLFQKIAYDANDRIGPNRVEAPIVATNRIVQIQVVEVVTTNRVVTIVDNVTITNYVVEVWTNGAKKSSWVFKIPPSDLKELPDTNMPHVSKGQSSAPYRVVDLSPGVQLWENGPYWAECNVGATKPEEYGYYFWWGDTAGYTKTGSGWISVKDGTSISFASSGTAASTFGKDSATLLSEGWIDSTGNLVSAHDAATAHLGSSWRMPTDAEFAALVSNCTTTWKTTNGVCGRLVTGKGDYAKRSIFLPAAGQGFWSGFYNVGSYGGYWSSTPISHNPNSAWGFGFNSRDFGRGDYARCDGQSVRPVRGKGELAVGSGVALVETHNFPYKIIDSMKSLEMGGAYGGDEVRLVDNTNGTYDVIHIFRRPGITQPLLFPKKNAIKTKSMRFLVVGGGGGGGCCSGGGGGAGGLVQKDGLSPIIGAAYVCVGEGGGVVDGMDINGEDTILTISGATYVAIGGGAGSTSIDRPGRAGGSGGGGFPWDGEHSGAALQPTSSTGGCGFNGCGWPWYGGRGYERLWVGCGGGGAGGKGNNMYAKDAGSGEGVESDISGECVRYAQGGGWCARGRVGASNSGNGGDCRWANGNDIFTLEQSPKPKTGGSGVVIVRYTVVKGGEFAFDPEKVAAYAKSKMVPRNDGRDKTAIINGVQWKYYVKKGGAVIGCRSNEDNFHPDIWCPAVPVDKLSGVVKIPKRIGGYRVDEIGKGAFQGCSNVRKFIVPESVKRCEARAFARCKELEEVEYPESVEYLGDGQVYRSLNIKELRFLGRPPRCDKGSCPYKCHSIKATIVAPYDRRQEWGVFGSGDVHICKDACHAIRTKLVLSTEEQKMMHKSGAGFLRYEFTYTDVSELEQKREDVWNRNDGKVYLYMPEMYNTIIPRKTAVAYATMIYMNAHDELRFKTCIDDIVMIYVDGEKKVENFGDVSGEYKAKAYHSKINEDIVVLSPGWHKIVVVAANLECLGGIGYGVWGAHGGAYYSIGENNKGRKRVWHRFEADVEGVTFRRNPTFCKKKEGRR